MGLTAQERMARQPEEPKGMWSPCLLVMQQFQGIVTGERAALWLH